MGRTDDTSTEPRLLRCHEVVVQHVDDSFECAGGDCEVDVRVHRFVVACADVDCVACHEAGVAHADLPLAA